MESDAGHITLSVDWRDRPPESWRGRKAVLASRGETAGPRVDECTAALGIWRLRTFLTREMNMSTERADALIDQMLTDDKAAS